jgi:predicted Holliday junction resolvase-like endonuclease
MSKVLSLALKINADSSGLKLDKVQRAFVGLGTEADKLTGQFAKFSGESAAAATAQEKFAQQAKDLINTLRDGGPNAAARFAAEFEKLAAAADKEAAAFERAAKITEANLSNFERFTRTQRELKEQVDAGRISLETYNRAVESAAKGLTDAERAAAGLAARVAETEGAAASTTLRFNELSGIFAVLPGPLGNIAGRISGISSAAQGLSRIFAGGLRAGIRNIAASFTSLINPLTASLAALAAFTAAATAIGSGLIALEDRVEKLGNTADKLGVSFQFIQTLEEAARRSGTSIDAVSSAFGRLQRSVLGVDNESKAAQKALAELGVTAQELADLSPDEQYQRIGRALADIEDPARRTAAATALFGRAGADLIPFFNNIKGASEDIERFGGALTLIQKQGIDEFGRSMDRLGVATRSASQQLLAEFAPAATRTADAATVVAGAVSRNAATINRIIEFSVPLVQIIDLTSRAILFFGKSSDTATEEAKNTTNAIARTAEEVAALNNGFASSQK